MHGIWAGMMGGTAVYTLIPAIITVRCDWENELSDLHTFSFSSSTKHLISQVLFAYLLSSSKLLPMI
jgi:hypothetical protein